MARRLSFDRFEVDRDRETILADGRVCPLQRQPFLLLAALVERPGEIVTREDLRRRLWADGRHVEFDQSLNTAVRKLRAALGDSPSSPRFIQTVAGQGYRFVGTVRAVDDGRDATAAVRRSRPQIGWAVAAAAGIMLAAIAGWLTIAARLTPDERSLSAGGTLDPAAWDSFVRGRAAAAGETQDGLDRASRLLRGALDRDPRFALAAGWLAYVETERIADFNRPVDGGYDGTRRLAIAALAVRPSIWPAHAALGRARLESATDPEGAVSALGAAIAAGADSPSVIASMACALHRVGRSDAALRLIEHGLGRHPDSPVLGAARGLYLHASHRYEEELAVLSGAAVRWPSSPDAAFHLGLGYARRGRLDDAIGQLRRAVDLSGAAPKYLSWLGRLVADAGQFDEARRVVDRLRAQAADHIVPPHLIEAIVYQIRLRQPAGV